MWFLIKRNGEAGDDGALYLLLLERWDDAELGVDLGLLAERHPALDLLELLVGDEALITPDHHGVALVVVLAVSGGSTSTAGLHRL